MAKKNTVVLPGLEDVKQTSASDGGGITLPGLEEKKKASSNEPTPTSEESSVPKYTLQQSSLGTSKVDTASYSNVDDAVDARIKASIQEHIKKEFQALPSWEWKPDVAKPQSEWTADDRKKVRDYNNTIFDIVSTTQEKDVQHFFNVIQSHDFKVLNGGDQKEKLLSDALDNKIKRVNQLHKDLQEKKVVKGDKVAPIDNDPEARWDEYDLPTWDKELNKRADRWITLAANNSVLGTLSGTMQPNSQATAEADKDILSHYNPSYWEGMLANVFGFMADAPLFATLGEIGGVGAKLFTKAALGSATKELVARGITRDVAQGIAIKSMSKATQYGLKAMQEGLTQGITLGSYNMLSNGLEQYKQAYANGEDIDNIDWGNMLKDGGKGFVLGLSLGVVSPAFTNAKSAVESSLNNTMLRNLAKVGVVSADFATEASLFTGVGAALDGRVPTKQDLLDNGIFLAALKLSSLPSKALGMVNISKTKLPKIEYTDREVKQLGLGENPEETITQWTKEDINRIASDKNIPLTTLYKVIYNQSGIAPVGTAQPDRVAVEEDNGKPIVRTYTNTDKGEELLSEQEYTDKSSANADARLGVEQIFNDNVRNTIANSDIDKQGRLIAELDKLDPEERDRMVSAFDTPVFVRTPEQRKYAGKFYELTDNIFNTGKNAYEKQPEKNETPITIPEEYATKERNIQEGYQQKHQEVDTGGQTPETGSSHSAEPSRQKQKKEKAQALAANIDEVLSASVDNLTPHDEIKSKLSDVIKENRAILDEIDPKYTKYLLERVNKAKEGNITQTIKNIEKTLKNAQLRNSLNIAYKASKKLKEFREKPEWANFVKSLNAKSTIRGKGTKLAVKINKIPVENLPDGVVQSYIEAVDNLTSKNPDIKKLEQFIEDYQTEIKKQQDLANVRYIDPAKAAERITADAERIKLGLSSASATPEDIMTLKRQLGRLKGEANSMKKLGLYSDNEKEIKIWDDKINELQSFLEELPAFKEDVQKQIDQLEKEYKSNTLSEVAQKWNGIKEELSKEKDNPIDTKEGNRMNGVMLDLNNIQKDEWALSKLTTTEVDDIKEGLSQYEETGIVPISILSKADKIKGLVMGSRAKGSVFDAVDLSRKNVQVARFLGMSEERMKRKISERPDIHLGSMVNLTKMVGGEAKALKPVFDLLQSAIDNPIYNYITHPGSEAINATEKMVKESLEPLYKVLGRQRQGVFKKYVFDFGKTREDIKPFDRIHILETQVRFWNMINQYSGRVVQQGDSFYGVTPDGEPYREGDKTKYFNNAEDAIAYVKEQPVNTIKGRPVDFYDLVNYDIVDGKKVISNERNNARLVRGYLNNEAEKTFFDEAYGELLRRAKEIDKDITDLSHIRTEEDALKLLNKDEKELWEQIRNVYDNLREPASIVAGSEGKALNVDLYYTPMNAMSMSDNTFDTSAQLDDLYTQVSKGGRPEVTRNILKKTNQIKYVDFNGLRVVERYVRDMAMSYNVLPAMRSQLESLKALSGDYKEKQDIKNFIKALRTNVIDGYKAEYNKRSLFGNIKVSVPYKGSYFVMDISKALRLGGQGVRNKLLNKTIRPLQDIIPNSIKTGAKGVFVVKDKAAWNGFYAFNPGVAGNIESLRYGQSKIGEPSRVENKGMAQRFTDEWIGKGDDFTKGKWPFTFMDTYKKLTGEEFDVNKYVNDWKYRDGIDGSDAFTKAKAVADGFIEENLVPLNKYSNRKAVNMLGWHFTTNQRLYDLLNAMSSYTAQENMSAIAYFNDIRFGNKDVAARSAIKIGQVIASNMAYNALTQLAYNTVSYGAGSAFGDESVKERALDNLEGMFSPQNVMANGILSCVNLMLGGYMNVGRTMLSLVYNGYKDISKIGLTERDKHAVEWKLRELDETLGLNRYIDPTLDLGKSGIPWETAINTVFPVIGSNFAQMGIDAQQLGKQPYNYIMGQMAENKYDADEFKAFELVKAANSLFLSYTLPISADINNMSKAMLTQQSTRVPNDLKEPDILINNFTLTDKEVNQMYEDKFNEVLERAKKDNSNYPIEEAKMAADKVVKTYLSDKDDNDYYAFYQYNKKEIDMLDDVMMSIVTDKTMKHSERLEWYKTINENGRLLQESFNSYKKGKDSKYMPEDKIYQRWLEKGLDVKWESINKNIEKKIIKIQSMYGKQ